MLNRQLFAALAALLLLAGCAPAAPAARPEPQLTLEPCRLSAPGTAASTPARCATLAAPEDPARPDGRQIELRIAVVPAVSRAPAPDPLFLLAGGPGQAAGEAFAPLLASLDPVNRARDLVLVDQRGTGGSSPLGCALPAADADPDDLSWARECLAGLDADPALYTSEIAAGDLDAARAALGYERINLLGVSYGTRLALTYARMFPERTRSLVLDGVVPQDLPIGAAMGRDGQRALDLTFARCAADPACAAAFPDLPGSLTSLLARLEADPPTVALADPLTGAPAEVELTRDLAAITVQSLSYAPETTALLPLLIHTAAVGGDLRPLAAQSLMVGQQLADSVDLGLRLSVICAEDAPFYPADPGSAAESYLGDLPARSLAAPCAVWPRGAISAGFREPVASDAPALLLSGELDPVTPPEYAAAAARTLPNSRQVVAPGQGHNVFFRGCLPLLVAEFVAAGDPAGLDVSCAERLAAPPFFTSFAGP